MSVYILLAIKLPCYRLLGIMAVIYLGVRFANHAENYGLKMKE
jgi:hypothetical protein